jgi:hypothetical protein
MFFRPGSSERLLPADACHHIRVIDSQSGGKAWDRVQVRNLTLHVKTMLAAASLSLFSRHSGQHRRHWRAPSLTQIRWRLKSYADLIQPPVTFM